MKGSLSKISQSPPSLHTNLQHPTGKCSDPRAVFWPQTIPWAGVRSRWGQESIFLVWALWETLFGNSSKSYHFLDFSFHFCQIGKFYLSFMRALVTQTVKNTPAEQEIWVQSLGQEDPLKKGMATHSSILAWRMPWTEESAGLLSRGSQRVGHD